MDWLNRQRVVYSSSRCHNKQRASGIADGDWEPTDLQGGRWLIGNAEIAGLDIDGLDNDGRMCGQVTELKLQNVITWECFHSVSLSETYPLLVLCCYSFSGRWFLQTIDNVETYEWVNEWRFVIWMMNDFGQFVILIVTVVLHSICAQDS